MGKRKKIQQEADPRTASSTGVRSMWAIVIVLGLILVPLTGPLGLAFVIGGILGMMIG